MIRNPCQLLLICALLPDARVDKNYDLVVLSIDQSVSVSVCTEFKISCKILNMVFVCWSFRFCIDR